MIYETKTEMMKKKKSRAFGKDIYLLGEKDGERYWFRSASWDCEWYWGIGYIETFTNNLNPAASRDVSSSTHFDHLFFGNGCDNIFGFFDKSTLTKKEKWTLLELMKSAYTARKYADMLHRGCSGITDNPATDTICNDEERNRINNVVIPKIMEQIYTLLTPKKENK